MNKNQRSAKIDLMIIGTQKGGTSALLALLKQHDQIQSHFTNEFSFFINPEQNTGGFDSYFHSVYPELEINSTIIAKSVGVMEFPTAIKKLSLHNPNVLLSVVLRDPIERAYSAFWFARSRGWEPEPSFSRAIRRSDRFPDDPIKNSACNYATRGLYYEKLTNVEDHFPRSQILISEYSELKNDSNTLCNDIFSKLKLPNFKVTNKLENKTTDVRSVASSQIFRKFKRNKTVQFLNRQFISKNLSHKLNQSFTRHNRRATPLPPMERSDYEWLADYFHEPNERLKEKYGIDFNSHVRHK